MIGNTMASARQQREVCLGRTLAGFAVAVAMIGTIAGTLPTGAATTEYVVIDRFSGLAISGFDPIAYFTDGASLPGRGEYELRHAGAVWRFRNEGNREAFAADPDIYSPRFGGYDPVAIAGGAAVPGDPRLWVVTGARLYLFNSPDSRAEFLQDTGRLIAVAAKQWPAVLRTLSP